MKIFKWIDKRINNFKKSNSFRKELKEEIKKVKITFSVWKIKKSKKPKIFEKNFCTDCRFCVVKMIGHGYYYECSVVESDEKLDYVTGRCSSKELVFCDTLNINGDCFLWKEKLIL